MHTAETWLKFGLSGRGCMDGEELDVDFARSSSLESRVR